jgi:hypothetical protein
VARVIEVIILHDGEPLAHIEVERDSEAHSTFGDYFVKYAVERGTAVGMHKRWIYHFPRKDYNALALVRQALMTLEPKELELESGFDPDQPEPKGRASDLARKVRRTMRTLQGG